MKHDEWMKLSKRGIMTPRSTKLKAVDSALQHYEKTKTLQALNDLSNAITTWMLTKQDWRESTRADAVEALVEWVRGMQGYAAGIAPANYAPSVHYKRMPNEYLVSYEATQTLTYPLAYQEYCNQWFSGSRVVPFPMKINFGIMMFGTTILVNVRALGEVGNHPVEDKILANWKTHCETAWNIATVFVGTRRYELKFNLIWVKAGAPTPYYTVKVHQPPPLTRANPTREQVAEYHRSGTPHLSQWGVEDRQAILHEFGHMIGNPDEYFTTSFSGLAAAYDPSVYHHDPFTTDSIMNNTASNGLRVYERHYEQVKLAISQYLASVMPSPLPPVSIRLEKPAFSPSAVNDFIISQAMHKRRRAMGYED